MMPFIQLTPEIKPFPTPYKWQQYAAECVSIILAVVEEVTSQVITVQFVYVVWFLPESVARVATIVGDHRCHSPRH
ncbi:hypothetical protein TNCV_1402121 [Trichonephila clavipes]|nr:hypothetical protein TNCV_1402121 [Trichonephila clavipes]